MKLHFSYSNEQKEGFETHSPEASCWKASDGAVEEISGTDVLEKVPNLVAFIDYCYRILKPGGKASFSAPYYASARAWTCPTTVRGMSEPSLNFSNKAWRDETKWTEVACDANFTIEVQFAIELIATTRSDDAKAFWMNKYNNVVQMVVFVLTKPEDSEAPPELETPTEDPLEAG